MARRTGEKPAGYRAVGRAGQGRGGEGRGRGARFSFSVGCCARVAEGKGEFFCFSVSVFGCGKGGRSFVLRDASLVLWVAAAADVSATPFLRLRPNKKSQQSFVCISVDPSIFL